ncbi:hypothetical protein Ade02nite_51790 [Paractinoplanes deccanensis]|uniref:Integral membrane protein n=1 Tax=Paractinoplanes deccanensis TaxID=113561 RepID=A0ABQ3Y947_9ACTN|nr:hypothetical protein Ade02nite_51790 [Actinoplanes deccanensis]
MQAAAARGAGTALALALSPLYLVGLAGDGGGWLLSLWALRGLPVYVVQAVLAGSLAVTVLLARAVLRTPLRGRDYGAVAVMVGALAVVGLSSDEQPASVPGHGTTVVLAVAGFAVAAITGAAVLVAGRTDRRGLLLAGLGGVAYSATALAGRAVEIRTPVLATLAEPLLWVVICTGVAGTAAYAAALRRGTVAAVTGLLWAVEVIVPALVAVPLLGDEIRHGWAAPAVLGVMAVVGAAAVLARSSGTAATAEQQPA